MKLRAKIAKQLGVRATAYAEEHSIQTVDGGAYLVARRNETPRGVDRTLTSVLGHPNTIDRGEVEYWIIDGVLTHE